MYNQIPGFRNPQSIDQGVQPMPPTLANDVQQKPPMPIPPPAPMIPPNFHQRQQPGDYYHGQVPHPWQNAVAALQNYYRNSGVAPRPLPGQQMPQGAPNQFQQQMGQQQFALGQQMQQGAGGMQPMPVSSGPAPQPLPVQPSPYAGTQVPPQGVGALQQYLRNQPPQMPPNGTPGPAILPYRA